MDLVTPMASALEIMTRLSDISRNIENAEFKSLLADLSIELSDAKLKIADLVDENLKLRDQLAELKASAAGEACPQCHQRAFELIKSIPTPGGLGRLGMVNRTYKCSSCSFSETRTVKS